MPRSRGTNLARKFSIDGPSRGGSHQWNGGNGNGHGRRNSPWPSDRRNQGKRVLVFIVGLGLMGQAYSERFYLRPCCTRSPPASTLPLPLMLAGAGILSF